MSLQKTLDEHLILESERFLDLIFSPAPIPDSIDFFTCVDAEHAPETVRATRIAAFYTQCAGETMMSTVEVCDAHYAAWEQEKEAARS